MNEQELQYADDIVRGMARTKAIQGLEGDTDQAAQAVKLEKSTGSDAQMIYGNHENFVKDYKGFLTQRMLDRNPGLEDYINSHPMAAIVSKDDWSKMADFYDHLDYWMGNKWLLKPFKMYGGAIHGFGKGLIDALAEPPVGLRPEEERVTREAIGEPATALVKGYGAKQEAVMKMFEALINAAAGAGEGAAIAAGATPTEAGMWGRRIGAGAQFFATDFAVQGLHPAAPSGAVIQNMMVDRAFKLGEPYLKAGEMPPAGVHPIWDAVIREDVEKRMEGYDALVDAVNKTGTKEVSPDMLARAIELKTKEDVFVHLDAVQKLYGEKIPEPGDKLLGDVPGVPEQYQRAIETGSDIQIPLSEWLARVDDEVVKALHDDIRFRPGEPTLNEVKVFPKVEQAAQELLQPTEPTAPVVPEKPLERLNRLKLEYAERLKTHGTQEGRATPKGNLLQSLKDVTGTTIEPNKVSRAMRWAYQNGRPDIVDRALEVARLSDPKLFARLGMEISNLDRTVNAQAAVKAELGPDRLFESPERDLGLLGILPKGREERYLRLAQKQVDKANDKILDEAIKNEKKRQTPEWNLNYAREFEDALAQLKDRPDFRVSAFFRSGVIGDQKMDGLPKLDPKFFTKDELDVLPKAWFRQRDGFAPDDIAGYFGYRTGQEMKNAMIRFEAEKGTGRPQAMMEKLAAQEAERRMQQKFGDLDENVLRAAREHEISLERFDLLHEETLLLATKLGQEFEFTKKDIRDQAHLKFNETMSGQVSLINIMRDIAKSNKATEAYWLSGDVASAYVERQRTLRLEAQAELAKKFEKDRDTYQRNYKRFSKREVGGIDPEYTNWIHHILNRVDNEVRSPIDLNTEIMAHNATTLEAFLKEKSGEAWLPEGYKETQIEFNAQIPVWEELINPQGFANRKINNATVGEFRAINESIKALIKAGRDELTGTLRGQAFERKAVLDKMQKGFEATMIDKLPPVGDMGRWEKFNLYGHRLKAGLLQMRYIWGRLDQSPYSGIFYDHFTRPFSEAGNEYRLLIGDFGKKLNKIKQETGKGVDLKARNIPNYVLFEPEHGLPQEAGPFLQDRYLGNGYLNRAQLRAVMLNIGDAGPRGNLSKLARGYGADPQAIMDWVNKHATKQDWDYVQGIWKLFDEIQGKDDIVSRNISGVAVARLPFNKVKTAFGDIDGSYYPMQYDQARGGGAKAGKIDPDLPSTELKLTDRGWEIERTSYAGPVFLGLGGIEAQLTRRLRSVAFREVLTESQRFFRNDQFQKAMTRHLGQEYTELLMPYLRDIAGVRGPIPRHQQAIEKFFGWFTQNTTVAFVGLNPGTFFKHNLTAFFQSFKEIKDKRYLMSAVHDMFTGVEDVTASNQALVKNFSKAREISAEIRGRRPNWMEALGGETDIITGRQTIRSRAGRIVSYPIAKMDQGISTWLWYAKYNEAMDELMPTAKSFEEARTNAISQADTAVVRTHGSTEITNRPAFMRAPMLKPFVALYGFFNHILNRMYEVSWEARKHRDLQTGEAKREDVAHLASQMFWTFVPAAVVEEMITPLFDKDDRSLAVRFLMSLGFPVTSSIPLVRELAHGLFTGHDPGFGILQGSMKAVTDFARQIEKGPNRDKFGDQLQATITLLGIATGVGSQQIGRWSKFGYNYFTGRDKPQTWSERYRAFRYGTSKEQRRH